MSEDISPFNVPLDPVEGYLTYEFFRSLKLSATTIFDIGVSRGTRWLYDAFPDCDFVLVDPLPGFQSTLINPPAKYSCVNVAVGKEPARLRLDLRGPRSSLHTWKRVGTHYSTGNVDVDVQTLDSLIEAHAPSRTLGIKIDTEGHEKEIIAGLDSCRSNIEFIICECSIRQRFVDDYFFSDLITLLAQKGFELYNFVSVQKPRPVHYDCLFLKREDWRYRLGGLA